MLLCQQKEGLGYKEVNILRKTVSEFGIYNGRKMRQKNHQMWYDLSWIFHSQSRHLDHEFFKTHEALYIICEGPNCPTAYSRDGLAQKLANTCRLGTSVKLHFDTVLHVQSTFASSTLFWDSSPFMVDPSGQSCHLQHLHSLQFTSATKNFWFDYTEDFDLRNNKTNIKIMAKTWETSFMR